ncbi:unnamed protein product [Agarophyton chilense]
MTSIAHRLLLLFMFVSLVHAQPEQTIPAFYAADCKEFRLQLLNHSATSFHDRTHATRVGIASMALFWTGLPAIPLGISAIWMGRRVATPALAVLKSAGVTNENYAKVNTLCATLLREDPLQNVTFQGWSRPAVILGAVALGLALFIFMAQFCYAIFVFFDGGNKILSETDSDDTHSSGV